MHSVYVYTQFVVVKLEHFVCSLEDLLAWVKTVDFTHYIKCFSKIPHVVKKLPVEVLQQFLERSLVPKTLNKVFQQLELTKHARKIKNCEK